MLTDSLPRVPLAQLPTPLEELPRFSHALGGPHVWIKCGDQTGLAMGGNKARKLEFLVGDALAQDATTLITAGDAQSNQARQLAGAAAKCGLRAILVLGGSSKAQPRHGGNVLLEQLLGADIRWLGDRDRAEVMNEIAEEERSAGERPYLVPYGCCSPVGASGDVSGFEELIAQLAERSLRMDHVVFASCSGCSQAGMSVAAKALHFSGHIIGISVHKRAEDLRPKLASLASATAAHLGLGLGFHPEEFDVRDQYLGHGYGVVGDAEREAIRMLAQTEGILLDPVYAGRGLAGLIGLIRAGEFEPSDNICFWHTGGTPALFVYEKELLRE